VPYLSLLLPDFILIACGFMICRYTALDRPLWEQVEKLVYFFLFPVLLFHSIVKSPLQLQAASGLVAGGLMLAATGIALSYLLPYLPILGQQIDRRAHAAAAQIGFRFNSFVGLALVERLAGAQGLLLMAVLIGICVPVFNTAAVWPMARQAQRHLGRELLTNPLILATVGGLLANLLGFRMPTALEPAVSRIGTASLALGLMAAGAGMQLSSLARAKLLGVCVISIKHLLLPLTAFALTQLLGLEPTQALVLMAFSALPTASSAYVLAARMGYDGSMVAALVTVSTLMGLLSLPLAMALAGR
jgi:malonate transporter